MRIAMDASPLIGTRTGIGVFVAELVDGFSNHRDVELVEYTVSVAARRGGVVRGCWVPLPARWAPHLWRLVPFPSIERFTGPVDVVHGTNYVVPPSRGRRVVSVYDLSFVHDRDVVPASVRRFDRLVAAAVGAGVTVHTMSSHVADEIRQRYGADRVVVVPGGVRVSADPDGGAKGGAASPPVVLALGSTGRRKRIPLLVAAFGRLDPSLETRLRIVGPAGDDEAQVAAAVASLPAEVRSRVERVGVVDDDTRDRELRQATVLAYPSEYEGFGFPVLEAMAAGTAVVTTDAGSLPEVAGDAALVVKVGDEAALAEGLADVLTDHSAAAQLVQAGLSRVETFRWERTVEEMLAVYTSD